MYQELKYISAKKVLKFLVFVIILLKINIETEITFNCYPGKLDEL